MDHFARFCELFIVERGKFALGDPSDPNDANSKYEYAKIGAPFTDQKVRDHLEGKIQLGVYNWAPPEKLVRWFCVDFDAPDEKTFPHALEEAQEQIARFEEGGLDVHLERSRSGNGLHVWGFLNEPCDAQTVRRAIWPMLMTEASTMDRGKIYPTDPSKSENGNLVGLPYGGRAREHQGGWFVNRDTLEPIPLETFVEAVTTNFASVMRRLSADAPDPRPTPRKGSGPKDWGDQKGGGRPDPLMPDGILKMISKHGCSFMHHCFVDRNRSDSDPKRVTEPQWYSALGQLTAFEHGREAAHMMWRDYRGYNAEGMDAKFNQARQNPPNGCAFIHERFPQFACNGCDMNAPYYRGQPPLRDLVTDAALEMEHGNYDADLERIWAYDAGELQSGITMGVEGFDEYIRFRNDELTVIAAQPSMGKTAFGIDLGLRVAAQRIPVFFFSSETGRDPLHLRIIAHEARVDSRALRGERKGSRLTFDEKQRVRDAVARIKTLPFYENYTVSDPERLLSLIERTLLKYKHPLYAPYLVVFDYLQHGRLDEEKGDKQNERLAELIKRFKALNKVLAHPVIVLSQTTRDTAGDAKPGMTSFAGTREIEWVIDQGLVLTGEYIEGPEAPRAIHGVKNKEGVVGWVIEAILKQTICHFDPKPKTIVPTDQKEGLLGGEDPMGQWTLGEETNGNA